MSNKNFTTKYAKILRFFFLSCQIPGFSGLSGNPVNNLFKNFEAVF